MKKWIACILCICLLMTLCACTAIGEETPGLIEVEYKKADLNAEWDERDAVSITFDGRQAEITGGGARLNGDVLIIASKGDYLLAGEFTGRIVIDADKDDKVHLVLSGLRLTTNDSAAIFIRKADKATITLADGSENTIIAGSTLLIDEDEELEAAIYSKADLVINGGGSLNVSTPAGHGILSKDDLRLIDGHIAVNAYADGLRGRDAVQMKGGSISVVAGGDGVKSNNDEDEDRGYVSIDGGELTVSAGEDGIQAETTLQILSGKVTVENSYEGMEAQYMLITGGEVSVTAAEDGLNAAGGDEAESRHPFAAGHQSLTITGGVLRVNAGGDGIDSNGDISFQGGEVYVSGPTDNKNAALDASGEMIIGGGTLLAFDASSMATTPKSAGQAVMMLCTGSVQPGGAPVLIKNSENELLISFTPAKAWSNMVISLPGLRETDELLIYVNDTLVPYSSGKQFSERGGRRK